MVRRLSRIVISVLLCASLGARRPALAQDSVPPAALAEPTVSPDHSEIAFTSGGDVWSVPSAGGTARLLADAGGAAQRPLFSPDGTMLAFVSVRPGSIGVEVLDLHGGRLRRLTYDDVSPTLDAWAHDGKSLYYSSSARAINGADVIRRVPVSGGTPADVRAEAYVNQMDAAPSPDGATLAYIRNGFGQWWRRGHSHIDEGTLTLERTSPGGGAKTFTSITHGDAKVRWPMWSPDGANLYFVSDASGSDELWERGASGIRALTKLGGGRVLWPTISRDGRLIAFERDLAIWTYDTTSGRTQRLAIDLRGAPASVPVERRSLTRAFSAFDLSPDGKKLAFVARATIFAADAESGGTGLAMRSRASDAADEPVWAPDSRRVAYVRDTGDTQALFTYHFPDGPEMAVTPKGHHDDYPHWSPDGSKLEFIRDGREIHLIAADGTGDRVLATGTFDRRPFGEEDNVAFSPGGEWLAYVDNPPGGFANAYVIAVSGGSAHALTALPNTNTGPLVWAPDGKRLYVVTSQRTEPGAVAQIDLTPQPPRFGEDTFRSLFDEPQPKRTVPAATPGPTSEPTASPQPSGAPAKPPLFASPKPAAKASTVRIEFADIEQRVTLLPTGLDVARISITPDSKTLVLDANAAGQQNLYSFNVDATSNAPQVATQLTNSSTPKARTRIAPDGKSVVFLDGGRFFRVGFDGKDARPIAITADLDVDFERDKRVVFAQVWSTLDRWYADPHFNGVDWAAQRRKYEAHALAAHTRSEFERLMNLMIGELDSSHSGYRSARMPGVAPLTIGNLGVDWDAAALERDGTLRFGKLIALGPVALTGRIHTGDELRAVDGVPVDPHVDVNALLANTIGKRTELRIAPAGAPSETKTVEVLPVDLFDDFSLRYHAWAHERRQYVDRVSGGKIGYVHLVDMGPEALTQFFTDLDVQNRQKLGVIIDLRNNQGGFVDPYALDVLARNEYLRFRSRFGNDAPVRTALGQRALDRPTALVVNEHTLSDGEDFTEGYRRQHLGTIVGVPTAGWIIFTSGTLLADGSQVRVPSTSVFTLGGVNMEQHPRPVDITVDNSANDAQRGVDAQLDAAIKTLLRGR